MSDITKKAISKSLKDCLQDKSLDRITIKDITDRCGISRMTFYYHFTDIYACLVWTAEQEAREALESCGSFDTWEDGVLELFEVAQRNKPYVLSIYHSIDRALLEIHLYDICVGLLMPMVHNVAVNIGVEEQRQEALVNFYKYSFVGIFLDWIRDGMGEDPETIVDNMSRILTGSVHGALLRLADEKQMRLT